MYDTAKARITTWPTAARAAFLIAVICSLTSSNAEGMSLLPFPPASDAAASFSGAESPDRYDLTVKTKRSSHAKSVKTFNSGQAAGPPAALWSSTPSGYSAYAQLSHSDRFTVFPSSRAQSPAEIRGPPAV
jgi:hypothetical protein